jgi:hypothetical protein
MRNRSLINSIDSGGGPWLGSFFFPHEQKQNEIIFGRQARRGGLAALLRTGQSWM